MYFQLICMLYTVIIIISFVISIATSIRPTIEPGAAPVKTIYARPSYNGGFVDTLGSPPNNIYPLSRSQVFYVMIVNLFV